MLLHDLTNTNPVPTSAPPEVLLETRITGRGQNQKFWEGSHVIPTYSLTWEPSGTTGYSQVIQRQNWLQCDDEI